MGRQSEIKIINVICIGKEEYLWDNLPDDKKREYGRILTEQMMSALGYVRKTA